MSNNNIEITEELRFKPKPDWLSIKLPMGEEYKKVREIVSTHKLHAICESGIMIRSSYHAEKHIFNQL